MEPDPGLSGAVPFRFQCQRSGRCCRVGAGFVWLTEADLEPMAAALGLALPDFVREHVRQVPDPEDGRLRLALKENWAPDRDRCRFLDGHNECRIYEARPQHCRDFPYWPRVLAGGRGFETARALCPGIAAVRPEIDRAGAFAALRALYEQLQTELDALAPRCSMSGLCCRFEEAGHELFAGLLETDLALELHPTPGEPQAPGRCPYHVGGICTAREGRPLACRTDFCDAAKTEALEDLHERYLTRLRAIEAQFGYDPSYQRFPALLARELQRVRGE
ncbi:MAG: YkgJ family cysteine cluster protein [Planctomycetota bacterium]